MARIGAHSCHSNPIRGVCVDKINQRGRLGQSWVEEPNWALSCKWLRPLGWHEQLRSEIHSRPPAPHWLLPRKRWTFNITAVTLLNLWGDFMYRILFAAALAAASKPVLAQGLESMSLANELGSVLASEKACNLAFDQAAIAAFIEAKVPANDMGFASTLNMMTQGSKYQFEEMSASSKTAHCTQIKRVAASYGFIEQ